MQAKWGDLLNSRGIADFEEYSSNLKVYSNAQWIPLTGRSPTRSEAHNLCLISFLYTVHDRHTYQRNSVVRYRRLGARHARPIREFCCSCYFDTQVKDEENKFLTINSKKTWISVNDGWAVAKVGLTYCSFHITGTTKSCVAMMNVCVFSGFRSRALRFELYLSYKRSVEDDKNR